MQLEALMANLDRLKVLIIFPSAIFAIFCLNEEGKEA
jgi:hypothetical protein